MNKSKNRFITLATLGGVIKAGYHTGASLLATASASLPEVDEKIAVTSAGVAGAGTAILVNSLIGEDKTDVKRDGYDIVRVNEYENNIALGVVGVLYVALIVSNLI
mgnify:CR=1 FL=1